VKVDVYIVWGSPASGKTTYVKNHMEVGDLVVDLDLIKQSLSTREKTGADDNLLSVALSVREHLYDLIRIRDVNSNNIWVIAGLPYKEDREELKYKLDATDLIHIEATQKECNERALGDGDRKDKDRQFELIDKWFDQFHYE